MRFGQFPSLDSELCSVGSTIVVNSLVQAQKLELGNFNVYLRQFLMKGD